MKSLQETINTNESSMLTTSPYAIVHWWTKVNTMIMENGYVEERGNDFDQMKHSLANYVNAHSRNGKGVTWNDNNTSCVWIESSRAGYVIHRASLNLDYVDFRTWCSKNNYPHR